jgi:hypothetical protein
MLTHFWSQVIVSWSPEILRDLIEVYPTRKWKGIFRPIGFLLAAIFAMMMFLLMMLFFLLLFIGLSPRAVYQILRWQATRPAASCAGQLRGELPVGFTSARNTA